MKQVLPIYNFSIVNQAGSNEADIYIDGDIVDAPTQEILKAYWGDETSVSYKSFRDQVVALNSKTLNIYINSAGGHIGDAMAIHDLLTELQENKGYTVNTKIMGLCASASTYIAMSTKNSSITENSPFMIHNVSGAVWGDVNVIENYAKTMRKFNNMIVSFYNKRTGLSETVIRNMMDAETWLIGQEAVDKGFISTSTGPVEFKNKINPDYWQFKNREALNLYNSFTNKNSTMDFKKIESAIETGFKNLMEKLGISGENKNNKDALSNFSDSIVNAIKEAIPTEEKIQEMVNKGIEEATKNDAETLKTVVNEATKGFINKEALEAEMKTLTNELSKSLGNGSGGEAGGGNKPVNTKKNRFSGVDWGQQK
ncbi:MAG: Clp protease ClpP [Chitinophagaceae bacterium]|nr:Clp protease ClpP [Chitinophagaceae bacterium]